jgi:predicted transcriptional regulator
MARQMTITLDDDVAARLDETARRMGTSADEVVLEAVRQVTIENLPRKPFKAYARDLVARPGIDFDCAARLLDDEHPHLK